MPRHEPDASTISTALVLLAANGFDGLANTLELLLHEAMRLERSEFLRAGPYERSQELRGYANGYKPKQVKSRLGELFLLVP